LISRYNYYYYYYIIGKYTLYYPEHESRKKEAFGLTFIKYIEEITKMKTMEIIEITSDEKNITNLFSICCT
jgi:hypothetical protein